MGLDLIPQTESFLVHNLLLPFGWKSFNLSNLQNPMMPYRVQGQHLGITLPEK